MCIRDRYSYDTHNNTSSIKNILDRSELKSMDIMGNGEAKEALAKRKIYKILK